MNTNSATEMLETKSHGSHSEWTRALVEKIKGHVDPIEHVTRLVPYISPQVLTALLDGKTDDLFESHRREITAVFIDLRGFTSFSNSVEPEEVARLLRSYHAEMGQLIFKFDGTLEHFAGDGILVFFNDPIPHEGHTERAAHMALAMRTRMKGLRKEWLKKGYDLDLGIGLVAGCAALGNIGFEGRMTYGAVGNVINLASRLSSKAKGGQILTTQQTLSNIENLVETEPLGEIRLKGFSRPIGAFNILDLKQREDKDERKRSRDDKRLADDRDKNTSVFFTSGRCLDILRVSME